MIGGQQNIDLHKSLAKDNEKIVFLLKRMTSSVARSWDFFPILEFSGGSFGLATLMTSRRAERRSVDGCERLHRNKRF